MGAGNGRNPGMRTPATPVPATPGPAPSRRRRLPVRFLGLLLLAAFLVGKGAGWIGRGDGHPVPGDGPVARVGGTEGVTAQTPDGSGAEAPAPEAATTAASGGPPAAVAEVAPVPAGASATPPEAPAAPAGETGAATAAPTAETLPAAGPATPVPAGPEALDGDRFACLLTLLQSRGEMRRFGEAMEVLGSLANYGLSADQQRALTAAENGLRAAMADAARVLAEQVRSGRVLAARASLPTSEFGCTAFAMALGTACGTAVDSWQESPRSDRAAWPQPSPLPRESRVRTTLKTCEVVGVVVDARSDSVTLRIANARGQTFPSVATAACEPIDPTAETCAEMGFAAMHAGDVVLARLWLCAAGMRMEGAASPRVARLRELLQ